MDYQTHLEDLRRDAAEYALISDLPTTSQKRELFAELAAHLNTPQRTFLCRSST